MSLEITKFFGAVMALVTTKSISIGIGFLLMDLYGLIRVEVETTFLAEIVFEGAIGFSFGTFPACFNIFCLFAFKILLGICHFMCSLSIFRRIGIGMFQFL